MIRAKHMFKEHSNLMLDLSSLLNKERPITFEESLNFVKKVKARDYLLYASLFDILSRKEHKPIEMYQELLSLFRNHDDLRDELARFRPGASPQPPPRRRSGYSHSCFWMFLFLLPLLLLSLLLVFEKPLRCLLQQTLGNC
ncbi:paired amphipathic helix protein Sin3-like 4 [Ananas comosus]|nr:paired amphipathic helix protein Sin3-like 4 [Ananas comosus]XP_020087912.1 paired amphipathic helix protein Sin3-like 4 [Ananas comosus]